MARWSFWCAALTVLMCRPALADGGKTVPGHCSATVDGGKLIEEPCLVDLEVGGGFRFATADASHRFHVVPDKATHTATATWTTWDIQGPDTLLPLGRLKQDGACWIGDRARICARSEEAEMLRNRDAPHTTFRPLLGEAVKAQCRQGECQWFRDDKATLVAHDDREALFRISGEDWISLHPDFNYDRPRRREGVGRAVKYVLCSRTRPAVVWKDGKEWTLTPVPPRVGGGGVGPSEAIYVQYAASCHSRTTAIGDVEGALLGYSSDPAQPIESRTITDPQDALK